MGGKERRGPRERVGMSGKDPVTSTDSGGNDVGETIAVPTDQEWQERLRRAVEETLRRRAAKVRQRQGHAQARAYGLQQRHAAKLARMRAQER